MRKVIFQMLISLDGFFEGSEREIDWHNVDDEFNDYTVEFLNSVDTLMFGRGKLIWNNFDYYKLKDENKNYKTNCHL